MLVLSNRLYDSFPVVSANRLSNRFAVYCWNSTGAVSLQHPRNILADMPDMRYILAEFSRGCHEDAIEETTPVEFQRTALADVRHR